MTDYKEQYQKLVTQDQISRRERIAAMQYGRNGFWDEKAASAMEQWIDGDTKKPKKEIKVASWLPEKPKRKYVKKSKRWKKKSAKKSA
jgi:hypothetical protein